MAQLHADNLDEASISHLGGKKKKKKQFFETLVNKILGKC